MGKKLSGSCGTGKKIIENFELFYCKLRKTTRTAEPNGQTAYTFDVDFEKQSGHFCIWLNKDNKIDESSTLDMGFEKSLPLYNDPTLEDLAKKMLKSNGIL
ncbi:hypothetical protein [Clostridium oceanicum]|uniref:Uncharacterized protein n=1 Tax=Clostridium oceanicum TaxID=1543 RepID=A0ABN1JC91_9CLOT